MSARSRPARVTAEFFQGLYEHDEDPWRFATSDYERDKYAHTLAALGTRRYGRALEVGCSIGVFTAVLADRCDELVAVDVSPRALALARRRVRDAAHVTLTQAEFPERMPAGPWDLVVCSEVLYYLDVAGLALAEQRLAGALEQGTTVLAVHWRPAARTYPWRGDEVHDRLARVLGRWHAADERHPRYRLDRFDPL